MNGLMSRLVDENMGKRKKGVEKSFECLVLSYELMG